MLLCGLSVVLIGFLFAFYFPTRTWLSQRRQTSSAEARLSAIRAANDKLARRVHALNQPATIQKLARSQYGMVEPGEKAYVLLPPPVAPSTLPQSWPFLERPAVQASPTGGG